MKYVNFLKRLLIFLLGLEFSKKAFNFLVKTPSDISFLYFVFVFMRIWNVIK